MAAARETSSPLTPRAVVLGLLLAAGLTAAGCVSLFLRYEIIGTGYLPRGVVCLLLLVVGANGLSRVLRRGGLRRGEVLLIFLMLAAMAAVPGQEYAQHFYLNTLGIVYYTNPEVAGPDLYLRDLPASVVPSLDRDAPVIRWAFEGLPPGAAMPWRPWMLPLLIWTPYILAMYWMLLCGAGLLARRWESQEKLVYPLVQVPVELADAQGGIVSPLFRNWLLWAGFAVSAGLYVLKGLHSYYPVVPDISLQKDAGTLFGGGPLVAYNNMPLHFYPEMAGASYLLSAEVALSVWVCYQLRLLQTALRIAIGLRTDHYQFAEMETVGGYAVLGLAMLWTARGYLAQIATAVHPSSDRASSPERLALWGYLGGTAFILWWSSRLGLHVGWAALLIVPFPLIGLVASRVVCEAGMLIYSSPFRYDYLLHRLISPRTIGARNVTLMTMMSWVQVRGTATQFMPQAFQCLKIGSLSQASRAGTMGAVMGAVAMAVLVSHLVSLLVIYQWGVPKLGWWPRGSGLGTTNRLVAVLRGQTGLGAESYIAMGLGAAATAMLVTLRQRVVWWPLHPLGFVAWVGWPTDRYWLSILLGWLAKVVVLRFFGYRAFAQLRPLAFGLVLGVSVILTFWIVFHFFVPGPELLTE